MVLCRILSKFGSLGLYGGLGSIEERRICCVKVRSGDVCNRHCSFKSSLVACYSGDLNVFVIAVDCAPTPRNSCYKPPVVSESKLPHHSLRNCRKQCSLLSISTPEIFGTAVHMTTRNDRATELYTWLITKSNTPVDPRTERQDPQILWFHCVYSPFGLDECWRAIC